MVVDDEAVITTQLEDRLQSMKYDVVGTASSAEESVSMARELLPDLILMDIVMKGKLDGIDAARIIKADMDIPIIFLTAYTEDKYIERAKNVEPFGYIVKPFRENEIRANIEIALYRKNLERKQKQVKERIRRLFLAIEHNPYMILIMDVEGKIEYANSRLTQFINYTLEEVIGKDIRFLKHGEMPSGVNEDIWGKITSGEEWRGELSIRKKDGTPDLKYTIALPLKNTNGDIIFFIVVMEDANNREKRMEMLLQSEKLNSIRTITAGIAHEFNNILAVIYGNVQLLRKEYRDTKELRDGLRSIQKAAGDGAEIVREMRKFTEMKKDTSAFVLSDNKGILKQAIKFTKPRWGNMAQAKGINYHIDEEGIEETPMIMCIPLELREVFVNIINNALDAMPDGGTITVATRCVRPPAGLRTLNSELKGDFIEITFADTGKGMPEDVKRKIFDPFFTTRSPEGRGLGLSAAYGTIKRHGGRIEVESVEGKGTKFTISIPITREVTHRVLRALSPKPSHDIKAKGLRILVVDDETEICKILNSFLSKNGHDVKAVNISTEAIKLLKEEEFDLVLADYVMPYVTGYEIAKFLDRLEKRPKIGIITGWDVMIPAKEVESAKVDLVVKKPFDLSEISKQINFLFDDA
ncbi:MAG: response regulator [Candidatus Scalindua sp.]